MEEISEDPQASKAPSVYYFNLDYSEGAIRSILGTLEEYCSTSDSLYLSAYTDSKVGGIGGDLNSLRCLLVWLGEAEGGR